MSQGNDFANYASSADGSANGGEAGASEDVWFVAVASDDIKQMSIDQLDEAFRLGLISAQTAVWTEGMETWAPLGEVADLDAEGDTNESSDGNGYDARAHESHGFGASPLESAVHNSLHQSAVYETHARVYEQPSFAPQQPSFVPGPSSFAPVTASLAPSSIFAPAPGTQLLQSSVPVALNVDEDMPSISRGRRSHPARWLLAAAAIVGLGVTAYNNSDMFSASAATATAAETTSSTKSLAARPYESGASVDKGSASKAGSDDEAAAPAKAAPAQEAAPIAAVAAKDPEAPSRSDDASKDGLKGSFSKAFSGSGGKKTAAAKSAKGAKPRKATARATSSRAHGHTAAAKAPKKPGVARAASAFDPLNGSLP